MVYTESEREEKEEGKQNDGEKDSQKFKNSKCTEVITSEIKYIVPDYKPSMLLNYSILANNALLEGNFNIHGHLIQKMEHIYSSIKIQGTRFGHFLFHTIFSHSPFSCTKYNSGGCLVGRVLIDWRRILHYTMRFLKDPPKLFYLWKFSGT